MKSESKKNMNQMLGLNEALDQLSEFKRVCVGMEKC